MITKQKYVEYLLSTPTNYTCTNLAEHLEGVSHDVVSDFLSRERLTPRHLWELVRGRINDSGEAFLIADDSIQDKRYSQFIEAGHASIQRQRAWVGERHRGGQLGA